MNLGPYKINEIYEEDSYEAIKKIPDNSIDLILIDPPYLHDDHGYGGEFGKGRKNFHDTIFTLSKGINFSILEEFVRVMKKINIYIFCSKNQLFDYLKFFRNKNCSVDLLTWHKLHPIPTCNNKYLSDTEYILFFREKGVKLYGTYKTKNKYFITEKNVKDKRLYGHPTPKPVEIIKTLIFNSSKEGDLVADFFIGSGTTAVASKQLNRHFIGFENNSIYFNNAIERIKKECDNHEMETLLQLC